MAISTNDLLRKMEEQANASEAREKRLTNEVRSAAVGTIQSARKVGKEVKDEVRRAGKHIEERIDSAKEDTKESVENAALAVSKRIDKDGKETRDLIKEQSGRHSTSFIIIVAIIGAIVGAIVFALCKFLGGDTQPVVDSAGNIVSQLKVAWPAFKCLAIAIPAGFLAFAIGLLFPEKKH